jgi:hypothetical protein
MTMYQNGVSTESGEYFECSIRQKIPGRGGIEPEDVHH